MIGLDAAVMQAFRRSSPVVEVETGVQRAKSRPPSTKLKKHFSARKNANWNKRAWQALVIRKCSRSSAQETRSDATIHAPAEVVRSIRSAAGLVRKYRRSDCRFFDQLSSRSKRG